jgi:hypothetical protein
MLANPFAETQARPEMTNDALIRAEVCLPTRNLREDLGFFGKVLKMRLDMIYPADNPQIAVYSATGCACGWMRRSRRSLDASEF